jgi:uncharacterized membrane-anchored protein
MLSIRHRLLLVATLLSIQPSVANADAKPAPSADEPLRWQHGPSEVRLGHGIQLDLPADHQFLGQPQAGQLMTQLGNLHNENLLGVVVAANGESDYLVTMRYDEEGFVKDDEALDADEILESIREGEEEYNAEREKAGFPPIHADGWQEAPHYDKAQHQLVWGLSVSTPDSKTVNYNTRILGRKGYVSVNLVTDPDNLANDKPAAAAILARTQFVSGSRYQDFNADSDKVAEYGLTGLVLGGAGFGLVKLAKIGLLAKFGKVIIAALIAGKKAIIALLVVVVAAARKLFSRSTSREA